MSARGTMSHYGDVESGPGPDRYYGSSPAPRRGIVDRLVGAVERIAPEWALRREVARTKADMIRNQGYSQHGASRQLKSMQGWQTARGGPDADITLNLDLLRQRSRDLYMGEPLAKGALNTIRTNEVGAGLKLNSTIDAQFLGMSDDQALEWEAHTERLFALWGESTDCDAGRRHTFGEIQALARLSELMNGDVFALLPAMDRGGMFDLAIRLLEADRVSDPWPYPVGHNVLGGVEVDEVGAPLAYYVARRHPGDMIVPTLYGAFSFGSGGGYNVGPLPPIADVGPFGAAWNTWDRIPAFGALTGRRTILHVMEAERPDQRRGVPVLAPVMERLKQLSRYSDAEIMAAVVSGFFTAAITSERPDAMPGAIVPPGQVIQDPDPVSYQLGNGAVLGLLPGEKLEAVNPARPNAGFGPFVDAVVCQIAAGLPGMTSGLLMKRFNASYSASRAELLEAWKSFSVGRTRLATRFCQPIYEQWLEEAVARGYVQAPGFFSDPLVRAAWCGAEWHGPAQGQLDPTKEAEAAEMRVESGFSTRTRETAELTGGNWERNNRVRVREEKLRRDGGLIAPPPSTDKVAPTTDGTPAEEAAA